MKQYKSFPFKSAGSAELEPNQFAGYASTFGNVDSEGDIIERGAFAKSLPEFLDSGFIAWQHRWDCPIGSPVEAYEDAKGLYLRASVSDTTIGRDAMTLMRDGVVKRMSIGFRIEGSAELSEEQAIERLGEEAYSSAVRKLPWWKDGIRLITQIKLYEVSPVSVPANPEAVITGAKGGGLGPELPFAEHVEDVKYRVDVLLRRSLKKGERRKEDGRQLSERALTTLREMLDGFKATADEIEAALASLTAPAAEQGSEEQRADHSNQEATRQELARFLATQARRLGAAV